MSGYIGNIPVPQATQTRQSFTATASQTTFNTAGYSVGYVDVFLNGVKLAPADYTATNGSDIILAVGAASGDILEIVAYEIFQVLDQDFTGDFTVDGTTFVVDSTNNRVGVGTASPSAALDVSTGGSTKAGIFNGNGVDVKHPTLPSHLTLGTQTGSDVKIASVGAYPMLFHTNGTERMRIDSSGNLLVGTTDTDPYTTSTTSGISLDANGRVGASYLDSAPMILNRRSSDGTIAQFRKDGTTVGSIGTLSSRLHIENGDTGLRIAGDLDQIFPCGSGGGDRDAAIDLGSTGVRFKDLYLSGGVYLGGTGASNHLDDYEEGTYTPVVDAGSASGTRSYAYQQGVYTKIGRRVFVWFDLNVSSWSGASGTFLLSLPFSSSSTSEMGQFTPWDIHNNYTGGGTPTQWIPQNSSYMYMYTWTLHSATGHNGWNLNTTGRISGSVSYTVD